MSGAIRDLSQLLAQMKPVLQDGVYALVCVSHDAERMDLPALVRIREAEGWTLVLEESIAQQAQLTVLFRAAWITLQVHSDLQAVGLTAAFSTALAQAGISCNVVAGAFHDHLLVPFEDAPAAMAVLQAMQQQAANLSVPS
ncbi:ACT domain-containing protein [Undibacterium sp. CY7W]|uniref:ACT domain-containing protein n=1 Tax=Undibacterium rugosum TaxID=2762291 RepID=A0A923IBA7_9BURK|nr:ACT domain-containing protein [Undibacterium rugosum]MBC3936958.1 ACT domain-containing protein [Undibacterium rugosum]